MSEQRGEKTEQATPRRLEEAWKKGQFARSSEVQTVFVLFSGVLALLFTGREIWQNLGQLMYGTFAHLHETAVTLDGMQRFAVDSFMVAGACLWPVLVSVAVGGLLACGMQSRFRTAPDALAANWERLNPLNGFQRIFSFRSAVPLAISVVKLSVIIALSYNVIANVLTDPIFYSSVDMARIGQFLAD